MRPTATLRASDTGRQVQIPPGAVILVELPAGDRVFVSSWRPPLGRTVLAQLIATEFRAIGVGLAELVAIAPCRVPACSATVAWRATVTVRS